MSLWSSLGGVSILAQTKESKERLKLASQSTQRFPSLSPFPQKPTSGHESCLPAKKVSSNPELVDVIEYPNPTIKGKKISDKIRWNQMKPYLSSIDAVTKHMNCSLIFSPPSGAKRGYAHSPLASTKIGKDALLSYQPYKSLYTMSSFPIP